MGKRLTVEYDEVGDILYLDVEPPSNAQVMIEVCPGTLLRKNTSTGRMEGIEISGLRTRMKRSEGIEVPVEVDLKPLGPVAG